MGEMAGRTRCRWDGISILGSRISFRVRITKDCYAKDARYILDVGSRASSFQGLPGGQPH